MASFKAGLGIKPEKPLFNLAEEKLALFRDLVLELMQELGAAKISSDALKSFFYIACCSALNSELKEIDRKKASISLRGLVIEKHDDWVEFLSELMEVSDEEAIKVVTDNAQLFEAMIEDPSVLDNIFDYAQVLTTAHHAICKIHEKQEPKVRHWRQFGKCPTTPHRCTRKGCQYYFEPLTERQQRTGESYYGGDEYDLDYCDECGQQYTEDEMKKGRKHQHRTSSPYVRSFGGGGVGSRGLGGQGGPSGPRVDVWDEWHKIEPEEETMYAGPAFVRTRHVSTSHTHPEYGSVRSLHRFSSMHPQQESPFPSDTSNIGTTSGSSFGKLAGDRLGDIPASNPSPSPTSVNIASSLPRTGSPSTSFPQDRFSAPQ